MASIDNNPPGTGAPLFTATLKAKPEDFVVDEVLGFELDGSGEHLYLHIQKIGANTDEIARLVERVYGVTSKDVGIAGMKDRHAVTTQWFSVTTPDNADKLQPALEDFQQSHKQARLIEAARHSRKLRRGAHTGNDFVIRLREIETTPSVAAEMLVAEVKRRIDQITVQGFPNYIGSQRFGIGGQNLVRARQWFRQPKKRTSRQQRSLWLSAARSAIFNAVCGARVADGSWAKLMMGEPAVLSGTRSFFDSSHVSGDELSARLLSLDIHPSAPWWGRGRTLAMGTCADYEARIVEPFADLCAGLERADLKQERRAIRAVTRDLRHQWADDTTLELSFHLPPGVFATTLLGELGQCSRKDAPETQ